MREKDIYKIKAWSKQKPPLPPEKGKEGEKNKQKNKEKGKRGFDIKMRT